MNRPAPEPDDETSTSLLVCLRNQDADAWLRLVNWIGPFLLRWCRGFRLPHADCEEISSLVVEKLWARIATFKKENPGDSFREWVHAIARNEALDYLKRRFRDQQAANEFAQQFPLADGQSGSPDDPSEAREWKSRALLLLVQDIKSKYTQDPGFRAFHRTAVDGLTSPEAAAELGLSKEAVRQHKLRWTKRLREQLSHQFGELID